MVLTILLRFHSLRHGFFAGTDELTLTFGSAERQSPQLLWTWDAYKESKDESGEILYRVASRLEKAIGGVKREKN